MKAQTKLYRDCFDRLPLQGWALIWILVVWWSLRLLETNPVANQPHVPDFYGILKSKCTSNCILIDALEVLNVGNSRKESVIYISPKRLDDG